MFNLGVIPYELKKGTKQNGICIKVNYCNGATYCTYANHFTAELKVVIGRKRIRGAGTARTLLQMIVCTRTPQMHLIHESCTVCALRGINAGVYLLDESTDFSVGRIT